MSTGGIRLISQPIHDFNASFLVKYTFDNCETHAGGGYVGGEDFSAEVVE